MAIGNEKARSRNTCVFFMFLKDAGVSGCPPGGSVLDPGVFPRARNLGAVIEFLAINDGPVFHYHDHDFEENGGGG